MRNALMSLSFAALFAAAGAAQASPCTIYFDALQAHPVGTPNDDVSCRAQLLEALTLDLPAVQSAEPATTPSAVIGTWLGDNLALPFAGAMTPGQEVLEITEGAEPGTLILRQYWYKVNPPPNGVSADAVPFDAEGHHTNLVAEAHLDMDERGIFQVDPFEPIRYPGARLQYRRVNELHVLATLNRFEGGGQFLRSGPQLVLASDRLPGPAADTPLPSVATFTRVADGAPDTALAMVAIFDQSQTRYFDCLTHQISAETSPLADVLRPDGIPALHEAIRGMLDVNRQMRELQSAIETAEGDDRQALSTQYTDQIARYRDLVTAPLFDRLRTAFEAETLGCPDPQDL
ncbi:hypothetical protein LCM17_02635 [Cereibacter sphaeroides]|nr:hypothetical protein [Cereibacter sphaeroides]